MQVLEMKAITFCKCYHHLLDSFILDELLSFAPCFHRSCMMVGFHICQLDTRFMVTELLIPNAELLIFYQLVGACRISSSSPLSLETSSIWMSPEALQPVPCCLEKSLGERMMSKSYPIATCIIHQKKITSGLHVPDLASFAHCSDIAFCRIEEFYL